MVEFVMTQEKGTEENENQDIVKKGMKESRSDKLWVRTQKLIVIDERECN